MLSTIIREKNRRVAAYRANVDRVWLLIALSFWQFASSFYVPREIDDWRFDFDFDKVNPVARPGAPTRETHAGIDRVGP